MTDRPATTDLTGRAEREHIRNVIAEAVRKAVPMHSGGWVTANNVLDALDREGYTVAPKVAFPHKGMTLEQLDEWWERWIAAARAPEAPGDANTPTPDVGAAQGGDDGSAAESEPRECDGADDPRRRCRRHHTTDIGNAMGGYNCCCGWAWLGRANECSTGAKTGDPVPLCDYVSDLLGYVANTSGSEDFDAQAAAVIPAIRAQTLAPLRQFADDMRTWCSPYGVAVTYADRLTEEIDRIARGDQ